MPLLGGHASGRYVIAYALKQRPLFACFSSKLYQRLQQLMKQRVAAKPFCVEVIVNLDDIARPPEVHQSVYLIDERDRAASRRFVAD